MQPARKPPTLADIDALPPGVKGEIIEGVLYTMTRTRGPHQSATTGIGGDLQGPFQKGRGGPGGWWIEESAITVVPDWVCEVLPPTTRHHNLLVKKPYYAKIGVTHLWVVDLSARTIAASRLQDGLWVELAVWGDEKDARIDPFADIALDVASWW